MIDKATFDLLKPMPPFKKELREANRENRKSQTRRVIKPQPVQDPDESWRIEMQPRSGYNSERTMRNYLPDRCPYGKAGDLRYMREPLIRDGDFAYYIDDMTLVKSQLTNESIKWRWVKDILSQLYMPKEAVRTFKRYELIRVERLQEISNDEAKAEGVVFEYREYRNSFMELWDSINAERGYEWDSNPWVWVIGYQSYEFGGA